MNRQSINIQILAFSLLMMLSCAPGNNENKRTAPNDYEEPLIEANKHVVKTEKQHIEDFLRRYKWEMEETGSGLRYMVYQHGDGSRVIPGKNVRINYSIMLITGDVVYTSDETGPMAFTVGKGEVISGLEEGILLLNVGDKAKFVIPSHLAYGLLGDEDRVPGKATLIYDIEVLNLFN